MVNAAQKIPDHKTGLQGILQSYHHQHRASVDDTSPEKLWAALGRPRRQWWWYIGGIE